MGIPHDPAALFVYALLVAAGWAIWKGSRSGSAPTADDDASDR